MELEPKKQPNKGFLLNQLKRKKKKKRRKQKENARKARHIKTHTVRVPSNKVLSSLTAPLISNHINDNNTISKELDTLTDSKPSHTPNTGFKRWKSLDLKVITKVT